MVNKMKLTEALTWASDFLNESKREAYVANVLLAYHLGVDTIKLHEMMREEVPTDVLTRFQRDVTKHAQTGEPVQHITKEAYFYGRKFYVSDHVLIPRYDTEFVVQAVIDEVKKHHQNEPLTIVDIGVGSGIIAITLALELINASIYATDISDEALKVAKQNAATYNVPITFMQGSYLEPVLKKGLSPNIIVSNPPYIPLGEEALLTDTVKDYDPTLALYGGITGLEAYEAITMQTTKLQNKPSFLAYEIGYNQGHAVTEIVKRYFPSAITILIPDFQGNDRVVVASLSNDV